jgi:hypothetical protein
MSSSDHQELDSVQNNEQAFRHATVVLRAAEYREPPLGIVANEDLLSRLLSLEALEANQNVRHE